MLSKKLVVILVLTALLAATQVADVEAAVPNRKDVKVDNKDADAGASDDKGGSNVKKTGWQEYFY